jgi:tetratricopeptide (TPR) repeat protein
MVASDMMQRSRKRVSAVLRWSVGLALLLALAAGAGAADLERAEALYREGALLEAAALARRQGGAAGLSLAARATLVEATYRAPKGQKPELFERAADDARQALARDPDNVDALLELALALGNIADLADPLVAHLNGYAKESRELLERARVLAPDDAWALGLLGIWHLQVVRRASPPLAEALYDASEEAGVDLCAKAVSLAPAALALRYGCTVSRLELDPEAHVAEALRELKEISDMPVHDVSEALVRDQARRRLDELRAKARD